MATLREVERALAERPMRFSNLPFVVHLTSEAFTDKPDKQCMARQLVEVPPLGEPEIAASRPAHPGRDPAVDRPGGAQHLERRQAGAPIRPQATSGW